MCAVESPPAAGGRGRADHAADRQVAFQGRKAWACLASTAAAGRTPAGMPASNMPCHLYGPNSA